MNDSLEHIIPKTKMLVFVNNLLKCENLRDRLHSPLFILPFNTFRDAIHFQWMLLIYFDIFTLCNSHTWNLAVVHTHTEKGVVL